MNVNSVYRNARRPLLQAAVLLVVFLMGGISCRETNVIDGVQPPVQRVMPGFRLGNYFSYDNWELDAFGRKRAGTYFRNSWTVTDTGKNILGTSRVVVVIDSIFTTGGQFSSKDTLYFRFMENGDVYQHGFLSRLIAQRETLNIAPAWDRIAALSLPLGQSWVMAEIDTSNGEGRMVSVRGRTRPTLEYVGVNLNDTQQALLSYRIEVTKDKLTYTYWLTDLPTLFVRVVDESDVLVWVTLRELSKARTQ